MDESNSNKSHFNLQPVDNNLLELVQKNKTIPTFLNTLIPNDPRLRCLKKAIHKGNFRARIWNNRHCNLYLTYLIQEKMIPFWHGITAYVYLIAKMQYTQTQDLRIEDLDVKFNYQVKIVPLVKAGKITELGYQYLLGMAGNTGNNSQLGRTLRALAEEFPVATELYNSVNPNKMDQKYYALKAKTALAARAASQLSYDKIQDQINYANQLRQQIGTTATLKQSVDLESRLTLENNLIQLEMLRQLALINQQHAIDAQAEVNEAVQNAHFLNANYK